jgi:hypothetical protein
MALLAAAHSHGYGRALLIVALVSLAGALSALFFGDSVQPPPATTS